MMRTKRFIAILLTLALALGAAGALAEGSWAAKKAEPVTLTWFVAEDW